MSIRFTSKSVKFTGALKAFTEKQLRKIEKISGDIMDCEVIVVQEKLSYKVEITLKTRLNSYHIEGSDSILKQALRTALNTLKAQAKKNNEKLKNDKKRTSRLDKIKESIMGPSRVTPQAEESRVGGDNITVSNNYSRKPLSVEEAIFFLKDSEENAYLFTNTETNKMSVVFFNRNNEISIIEAN
jgi:putative sigma-54 modulation protein